MNNHIIVKNSSIEYTAQGVGNYFSWSFFFEYGEWVISSIWGRVYARRKTLVECLAWLDGVAPR